MTIRTDEALDFAFTWRFEWTCHMPSKVSGCCCTMQVFCVCLRHILYCSNVSRDIFSSPKMFLNFCKPRMCRRSFCLRSSRPDAVQPDPWLPCSIFIHPRTRSSKLIQLPQHRRCCLSRHCTLKARAARSNPRDRRFDRLCGATVRSVHVIPYPRVYLIDVVGEVHGCRNDEEREQR
jgi:hypothetical protein